ELGNRIEGQLVLDAPREPIVANGCSGLSPGQPSFERLYRHLDGGGPRCTPVDQRWRGMRGLAGRYGLLVREAHRHEPVVVEAAAEQLEAGREATVGEPGRDGQRRGAGGGAQLAIAPRGRLTDQSDVAPQARVGERIQVVRIEDSLEGRQSGCTPRQSLVQTGNLA